MAPIAPEVEEGLLELGIRPRDDTDPAVLRELLNAWYVFEIRQARLARREAEEIFGPQPIEPYRRRIEALRRKYWLLGLPVQRWYS